MESLSRYELLVLRDCAVPPAHRCALLARPLPIPDPHTVDDERLDSLPPHVTVTLLVAQRRRPSFLVLSSLDVGLISKMAPREKIGKGSSKSWRLGGGGGRPAGYGDDTGEKENSS